MIKALLGCTLLSIMSVWGKLSGEEHFYARATWDNLLFGLTLVLPEIAEFTGIIAALSHSRLDLLNNSDTHADTHAHFLPWAPVCGLSGAADGWLIDWGGPLMISVANDLLNNSLSLCWGTDGRPNTYADMLTGRRLHTRALEHLFVHSCVCIKIFLKTSTHTFSLHSAGVSLLPSLLLLTPRVLHVSATLASWYHRPVHSLSEQKKKLPDTFISTLLAYQYWFHSLLSLLLVLCVTWTLCGPSICRAFLTQLLLFFSSKLLRFNSYSNF